MCLTPFFLQVERFGIEFGSMHTRLTAVSTAHRTVLWTSL